MSYFFSCILLSFFDGGREMRLLGNYWYYMRGTMLWSWILQNFFFFFFFCKDYNLFHRRKNWELEKLIPVQLSGYIVFANFVFPLPSLPFPSVIQNFWIKQRNVLYLLKNLHLDELGGILIFSLLHLVKTYLFLKIYFKCYIFIKPSFI